MSNKTTESMAGRCLCGAVTFTARDVETAHHACHCGMCRRWAGSPLFVAEVGELAFDDSEPVGRYASSDWAERGFCKLCGSSLYYRLREADRYWVSVGAFDDAAAFTLAGEIFVDHRPAGYAFAGDLPGLTEQQVLEKAGAP